MTFHHVRRRMSCAAMIAVLLALAACSTVPKAGSEAEKKALEEKVNERLSAADKAQKDGQIDQAFVQLDQAIRLDPAAKQPWLKKAQIHFDARQYGLAITEAEEVLQRDVNDLTAKSILAVSGLRVSAQALEQLRKVNEVNGSARSEAESVARIIREALGEPILVSASADSASGPSRPKARAPRRTPPTVAPPAGKPEAAATSKPATASGPRNNPFGALH